MSNLMRSGLPHISTSHKQEAQGFSGHCCQTCSSNTAIECAEVAHTQQLSVLRWPLSLPIPSLPREGGREKEGSTLQQQGAANITQLLCRTSHVCGLSGQSSLCMQSLSLHILWVVVAKVNWKNPGRRVVAIVGTYMKAQGASEYCWQAAKQTDCKHCNAACGRVLL